MFAENFIETPCNFYEFIIFSTTLQPPHQLLGDFAGGWEMHSEIFLELVERLLGCIDSLEPRGLSMTAYSAAKLLFGDHRRSETYVRDPKNKGWFWLR